MSEPVGPELNCVSGASASSAASDAVVGESEARRCRACVVVPAFNEERSVGRVVEELYGILPTAEVVVVDDGCTDATAEVALRAGATVVSLPVNLGIGGAVQAGYRYAVRHGYSLAVQVDGDGQHDPREVPRLLKAIESGEADLAIGSRWLGRGDYAAPANRRVGMWVLMWLVQWRTGQKVTDTTSGFRAIGPRALRLFAAAYPIDFPEVESIVMARRAGLTVCEVPVIMSKREYGRSSIGGWRSAYYMARVGMAVVLGGPGPRER